MKGFDVLDDLMGVGRDQEAVTGRDEDEAVIEDSIWIAERRVIEESRISTTSNDIIRGEPRGAILL